MASNKYLLKISQLTQRQQEELEASKVAGKALVADKVGDVAGAGVGGVIAAALKKNKATGALLGAGILGSGLTYASIRRDHLNTLEKSKNYKGN